MEANLKVEKQSEKIKNNGRVLAGNLRKIDSFWACRLRSRNSIAQRNVFIIFPGSMFACSQAPSEHPSEHIYSANSPRTLTIILPKILFPLNVSQKPKRTKIAAPKVKSTNYQIIMTRLKEPHIKNIP
jgi:hypothetical protein